MARLATAALVNAVVRRANQLGGSAMVLARGDDTAGGILFVAYERGGNPRFFERGLGARGVAELLPSGPATLVDEAAVHDYWQRRRARDSDLWVLELDIADAERFAAETLSLD